MVCPNGQSSGAARPKAMKYDMLLTYSCVHLMRRAMGREAGTRTKWGVH